MKIKDFLEYLKRESFRKASVLCNGTGLLTVLVKKLPNREYYFVSVNRHLEDVSEVVEYVFNKEELINFLRELIRDEEGVCVI